MHLLYAVIHSDHIPMDAPLIHSHEPSPLFCNVVVSIPKMGLVPHGVPKNVSSLHIRGGVRKNHDSSMNVYSFHHAEDYCTAVSETRRQR